MPTRRAVLASAVLLLFLPFVSVTALAQPATPEPTSELVRPPEAPTSGPGAEPTAFPAARILHYGDEPGGFWLVEPTSADGSSSPVPAEALPVILYLSGCCGNGDYPTPEEVQPWLEHLARSGAIVIAPVYHAGSALQTASQLFQSAVEELNQPGHALPDYDRFGIVGFSFGGSMAVDFVGAAATFGLPEAQAIFVDAPCEGSVIPGCVPLESNLTFPAGMKALVLVFSADSRVGSNPAKKLWTALGAVPTDDKDFVTMVNDTHGYPWIQANHETTYQAVDAADWYGIWKLSTALFDRAFTGASCEYALGNTPEQTFMGTWSDGTPVTPLVVTDVPEGA